MRRYDFRRKSVVALFQGLFALLAVPCCVNLQKPELVNACANDPAGCDDNATPGDAATAPGGTGGNPGSDAADALTDDANHSPPDLPNGDRDAAPAVPDGAGGSKDARKLDGADVGDSPVGSGEEMGAGGTSSTGGTEGSGGATGAGGVSGTGGSGSGGITSTGGTVGNGGGLGNGIVKLTGTTFGTGPPFGNNPAVSFDKAYDGDITTYDDDQTSSGGYTGIDLGAGVTATVSIIRYYPRIGSNQRMLGGKFQCSTTSQTAGYADLHAIPAEPPQAWTEVAVSNSPPCRYLRYLGPTGSATNVAEVEFWGLAPGDAGVGPGPQDAGMPMVNLALGRPASASDATANAANGNDGVLTTLVCPTPATFPLWWKVDLGAVYALSQTGINFQRSGSAYKYVIEVSSDDATWTKVIDQSGNTTRKGGTVVDNFSAQGRYVRLTISGVSTADGPCFMELNVWGSPKPSA